MSLISDIQGSRFHVEPSQRRHTKHSIVQSRGAKGHTLPQADHALREIRASSKSTPGARDTRRLCVRMT